MVKFRSVLEKLGSIPKSRKLVLTMSLPARSRAEETRPLVELALNLLDVLAKGGVPSDTINKSVSACLSLLRIEQRY